ncbi:rCG24677, isoform CRA_b [Rattus norvegicus]|uniref:RCG24677, isoform CRA_b n=1 Tax=Rattus norvegicus TaxID=10116 RepID=A6JC86_RAT|nr:rCG24677, isoform CRA_b [Rattus norvegicus]
MARRCMWGPERPSLPLTATSASCRAGSTKSCCGVQILTGSSSAASRARTQSVTVKTTSRSFCPSTAAICSPVAPQPSAPCVLTLTQQALH